MSKLQHLEAMRGPLGPGHPIVYGMAAAVPIWAMQLSGEPLTEILAARHLERVLDVMMEVGEALLFRVPGKSAPGFNALAEGIARLAYCQGGVRCFGMHFEYEPGKWAEGKHGVPIDPVASTGKQEAHSVAGLESLFRVKVREARP